MNKSRKYILAEGVDDSQKCFCCGKDKNNRFEKHHFPRSHSAGGELYVPLCGMCHDTVDRYPLQDWPEHLLSEVSDKLIDNCRVLELMCGFAAILQKEEEGGGCGGGAADGINYTSSAGGSGTAAQGFDGGTSTGGNEAAGGGGAAAVGTFGTGGDSSPGGAGLASSITGSAVTRSVGGDGADSSPDSKTANRGEGGDASKDNLTAPTTGSSGVVIIRVPTASYSSTTSGSPSVSTSGSDTIMIFNASGSYTG